MLSIRRIIMPFLSQQDHDLDLTLRLILACPDEHTPRKFDDFYCTGQDLGDMLFDVLEGEFYD
jgi:hypothetical protein